MEIILASTSSYRRVLLQRLHLNFRCEAPDADETPLPGEPPETLARRLALAKANSVAANNPGALVIGSDQVAAIGQQVMGKPGHFDAAAAQLRASSGRDVHFYTGLSLVCLQHSLELVHVEPFSARFRELKEEQITNYLRREQPYDCAGSFKVEGLGIALFKSLHGDDPTSLEGLPLIALTAMLEHAGVSVLSQ